MSDDNWYQRRLNFNGANLNITFSPLNSDLEPELFSLFQHKFNFTFEQKAFQGFGGILEDSTRTGSIGEILNGNLDLGTYFLILITPKSVFESNTFLNSANCN